MCSNWRSLAQIEGRDLYNCILPPAYFMHRMQKCRDPALLSLLNLHYGQQPVLLFCCFVVFVAVVFPWLFVAKKSIGKIALILTSISYFICCIFSSSQASFWSAKFQTMHFSWETFLYLWHRACFCCLGEKYLPKCRCIISQSPEPQQRGRNQ